MLCDLVLFFFLCSAWSFTNQYPPYEYSSLRRLRFTSINQDLIIQTNAITVPEGIADFQVVAYKKSLTGTGNVTFNMSLNNGVTYQTGLPIDTIINSNHQGTQMILQLSLNAGASEGIAECKGYGIRYW